MLILTRRPVVRACFRADSMVIQTSQCALIGETACTSKRIEACAFFASTRFNASKSTRIGRPGRKAAMRSFF